MATANERIHDALTRRQIEVIRYARGLSARMVALLDRAEPDLRAQLKGRIERAARLGGDPGPVVTERIRQMERAYRETSRPTWEKVRELTRGELVGLAADEVAFIQGVTNSALPVTVDLAVPNSALLRKIVFARPFQGRILRDWLSRWEVQDRRRAMAQIRQGLLFNETPTQIGRRIFGTARLQGADGVRNITRRGAQVLAQTASASITNAAAEEVWQANSDIAGRVRYTATLDSRTTPICRALDGKLFDAGKGPKPPVHMNCRSRRVPIFNGRALGVRPEVGVTDRRLRGLTGRARERRIRELVGQVPAETNYAQFLRRQGKDFQVEVLGVKRAALFRARKLTLQNFVDLKTGRQYTLRELRARHPRAFRRAA